MLDLAHLAYIPQVSLRNEGGLTIKISRGGWQLLDIQTMFAFNVAITDVVAFMKSTKAFYFTFPCNDEWSHGLMEELEKARAKIGTPLFKYHDNCSPIRGHHSFTPTPPLMELSNHRPTPCETFGSSFSNASIDALHLR